MVKYKCDFYNECYKNHFAFQGKFYYTKAIHYIFIGVFFMECELFKRIVSRMQNAFCYNKIIYNNKGQAIDYEIIYANKAYEELTGLKRDYIVGKRASELKYNEFIVLNLLTKLNNIVQHGIEDKIEQYFDVWKRWYSIDVFSPEEHCFGLLYTDITDMKNLTSTLAEQKEVMKQITENLEEITFLMDIQNKSVIYASTSAERLTGISVKEFYTNHHLWTKCIVEEDKDRVIKGLLMENLLNHFNKYPSYIDEFRIIDCNGKLKWVRIKCMLIRDEENRPQRLVGIIQETTNEKQDKLEIIRAKNKAEKLAMFDYLTRTYNRRAFFIRAREEYSRAKRLKKPVAVILTDLDKFKQVNDKYGHDAGDLVLKNFSKIIKRSVRKYDVVARFGGEEFVILLNGIDKHSAYKKAEELRRIIESTKIYSKKLDSHLKYTASFGVAAVEEAGKYSLDELISKADMALYKAKNNGRNRVESI